MNESVDPLSGNLINLSGQRWKILRSKLTSAFTAVKIRNMFGLIEDAAKKYKVTYIIYNGNFSEIENISN